MSRRGAAVVAFTLALLAAGCDSSSATSSTTSTLQVDTVVAQPTAPATTEQPRASDPVPRRNAAADSGCLDEAGVLSAPAADWYSGGGGGSLALGGAVHADVGSSDPFQEAARTALIAVAPAAEWTSGVEYRRVDGGCVTHRYALFDAGEDGIVVSAWRVESAANPFWVANDGGFTTLDDATLVSRGVYLSVILVVAPDGTTARVSAYGAHARDLTAGWPTTVAPNPGAPAAQPAQYTTEQLIPIAKAVLTQVLAARPPGG